MMKLTQALMSTSITTPATAPMTAVSFGSTGGDKLYVLHGYWNTTDEDGVAIVGLYRDLENALSKLDEIEETKASQYFNLNPYDEDSYDEIREERMYELIAESGDYVKFYITENYVE